ncbi:hypothetical protein L596_000690 [Steinernema carpocapsae]|uniref:Uncharacterized protein n=1 Tax=Steinernema carpocapsae TaxID=34508 RepID=A0A4U8UJI6_STECR|nr:hypothetical protein L596_000690 [Steinernema carpocapsae]
MCNMVLEGGARRWTLGMFQKHEGWYKIMATLREIYKSAEPMSEEMVFRAWKGIVVHYNGGKHTYAGRIPELTAVFDQNSRQVPVHLSPSRQPLWRTVIRRTNRKASKVAARSNRNDEDKTLAIRTSPQPGPSDHQSFTRRRLSQSLETSQIGLPETSQQLLQKASTFVQVGSQPQSGQQLSAVQEPIINNDLKLDSGRQLRLGNPQPELQQQAEDSSASGQLGSQSEAIPSFQLSNLRRPNSNPAPSKETQNRQRKSRKRLVDQSKEDEWVVCITLDEDEEVHSDSQARPNKGSQHRRLPQLTPSEPTPVPSLQHGHLPFFHPSLAPSLAAPVSQSRMGLPRITSPSQSVNPALQSSNPHGIIVPSHVCHPTDCFCKRFQEPDLRFEDAHSSGSRERLQILIEMVEEARRNMIEE